MRSPSPLLAESSHLTTRRSRNKNWSRGSPHVPTPAGLGLQHVPLAPNRYWRKSRPRRGPYLVSTRCSASSPARTSGLRGIRAARVPQRSRKKHERRPSSRSLRLRSPQPLGIPPLHGPGACAQFKHSRPRRALRG